MTTGRVNQKNIYASFERGFVTAILGPRRVGKTSLVEAYMGEHPERTWVAYNCDDFELRRKLSQKNILEELIVDACMYHIGDGEKVWVVIDEVQKCPECFDQIKLIYDNYKDQNVIKFILTGSALLELHRLSAESLAGRIEMFYLSEFSLQETVELIYDIELPEQSTLQMLFDQDIDQLSQQVKCLLPRKSRSMDILELQMIWGGLPEVLLCDDDQQRVQYLSNYLQTYLEKDIRPMSTISNIELYRQVLDVIAEQTGSIRDDSKLLNALDCSRDTFKKYRATLAATLMYYELYPYISSSIKRISKSPKGYLINNGLVSYLTGFDKRPMLQKANMLGHRFENWIFKELQVVLANRAHRSNVHYWRMSNGREVDFVVDYKPYVFPIEATYADKVQDKKVKTLEKFLVNEDKAPYAIYVYCGDFAFDKERRIFYIPAWAVC